jgi:hypothetical protein
MVPVNKHEENKRLRRQLRALDAKFSGCGYEDRGGPDYVLPVAIDFPE